MVGATVRSERDWTRGLQALTGLAAIGTALAVLFWLATIVFYAVQRAGGPSEVTVGATLPSARLVGPRPPADGLAGNVSFATDAGLPVAIHQPDPGQYVLGVLERLPTLAVYAVFFVLLWRLVRTARHGGPYSPSVVRGLRRLGALLLAGTLLAAMVEALAEGWLSASLLPAYGFVFHYDLPGGAVIGGASLLAVSEVVRRGVRMREDLEGTV